MILLAVPALGADVNVYPGNIGSGSLSITGTGWTSTAAWLSPAGNEFGPESRHSYDMSGGNIALQGFVNVGQTADANVDDWSKYYAKFTVRDNASHNVDVVFGTDWLGGWSGIDPQPWDRIRMENNMGLDQPEQHYCTVGGTHDMGGGGPIYPSDRNYYMQLVADAPTQTFTLQAFAMGSSAPITTGWPPQNTLDEAVWQTIGSIQVGEDFNFANVEFCSTLWSSTQAAADETSTVSWNAMNVGTPLTTDQVPVPEPATLCLLGLGGLGALIRRRRKA